MKVDSSEDDQVPRAASLRQRTRDLWALTKPAITLSNVLMTGVGLLVVRASVSVWTVVAALLGTALVVASANAYNMVLEGESDRLMERTARRPVASGRLPASVAWVFASALGLAGVALLALGTNAWAALVGGLAVVVYAFVYTPMKRVSSLALPVGALPGATPPLIGVLAAAPAELGLGLALASLLFLWQFPHFLAIAARRKSDYARAGIRAFSVVYGDDMTRGLARWTALGLVPVGLVPHLLGAVSVTGAVLLTALGMHLAVATLRSAWVRPTFLSSLLYLPGLWGAILIDRLVA